MKDTNTESLTANLRTITTQDKRQIINALCFNEGGYELTNPNTLLNHFGVSTDDLMGNIESIPSWIFGANGFEADMQLRVKESAINMYLEKYPQFDLQFSKSILQDILEMDLEDLGRAKKEYKEMYKTKDAGYKFIKMILKYKENIEKYGVESVQQ